VGAVYYAVAEGSDVLIDDSLITSKTHCVHDLLVLVEPDLKFTADVHCIASRARTRCNLILKCFVSKDGSILVKAFTAMFPASTRKRS